MSTPKERSASARLRERSREEATRDLFELIPANGALLNGSASKRNLAHPKASTEASISAAFAAIDWNFASRKSHSEIEGIHPYPAKFVAEIPRAVLETLPIRQGTSVFDPYCGSGTTLVEAQRKGFASIGVDLNPIACLIAQVKTAPLPSGLASALNNVLTRAQLGPPLPVPRIPNLDHWFERPIQEALTALTSAIEQTRPECRDILRLALSSIIVRVSNQESDTRYAAVQKDVTAEDVFSAFSRAVLRISSALRQRSYALARAQIVEADTLTVNPESIGRRVGLVITSPPYPNAYEYWLYHKYRMWWLGFDPIAVKAAEIGARAHFFKVNNHTAENFEHQMAATLRLVANVLMPGGYACFVIGRSKIHGSLVDNASVIEKAGEDAGFRRVVSVERVLSPNRKSFNLSHANIKTETVMVLRLQ